MPIFITQGRYSRQALRGMLAKPEDRAKAAIRIVEAAGGKLLSYYVTFGEYDWQIVTEMPNETQAAAFLVTVGASEGLADIKTTLAMTTAQAMEAFEVAGELGGSYSAPGEKR